MFYLISYENEDVSILDMHASKPVLELNLRSNILDFFKSKNIEIEYEKLFQESDTFYLVKNENGSISIYQKTINTGYIYNEVETREIRVYYMKGFNKKEKPKINLEKVFIQQKSKLKKTVIIHQKKEEFNIMTELLKNPKFLKIRTLTEPYDTGSNSSEMWFEIDSK